MDSSCEYAPSLVLLATAWGPKHGGINAFNVELARSLAILPERNCNLFCVVPLATEEEIADAHRDRVRLVSLDAATPSDGTFGVDRAAAIVDRISAAECLLDRIVWIGHDDKTGFLAIALRDACTGSKALLVHLMAARA